MRVLIADDSPLILDRMQEMVSMDGVDVIGSYSNGTDMLEAIRTLKPDLAIVDITMPGLTGLEVLSEIRKENKEVKFIILTLFSTDYYRQIAMEQGADYFFSKVDDFEKIAPLLRNMQNREKTMNNYQERQRMNRDRETRHQGDGDNRRIGE